MNLLDLKYIRLLGGSFLFSIVFPCQVYFGETSKNNRAQSLTCPLCGKMGFTAEELLSHSGSEHGDSHARVSCPVCVATRNPVHPPVTQHIVSHLQVYHRAVRINILLQLYRNFTNPEWNNDAFVSPTEGSLFRQQSAGYSGALGRAERRPSHRRQEERLSAEILGESVGRRSDG